MNKLYVVPTARKLMQVVAASIICFSVFCTTPAFSAALMCEIHQPVTSPRSSESAAPQDSDGGSTGTASGSAVVDPKAHKYGGRVSLGTEDYRGAIFWSMSKPHVLRALANGWIHTGPLDSRIKCNMIEVIRRCLVEKLLRSLKVKTFSWPGIQQPRNVVQSDLAHA